MLWLDRNGVAVPALAECPDLTPADTLIWDAFVALMRGDGAPIDVTAIFAWADHIGLYGADARGDMIAAIRHLEATRAGLLAAARNETSPDGAPKRKHR